MAVVSTQNRVAQKLSLREVIALQGVKTAPILNMLKRGNITSDIHGWFVDRYADAKDNAHLEITGLDEDTQNTREKIENRTQIIKTEFAVSKRESEIAQYGGYEVEYQTGKKAIEHAKDIEFAILGLGNATLFDEAKIGAASTPQRTAGFFHYIPEEHRKKYTTGAFTYQRLCEVLQPVWRRGGIDGGNFKVFLGSLLKAEVMNWRKEFPNIIVNQDKESLNPLITKIATDFGTIDLQLHRLFEGDKLKDAILVGNFDESSVKYLTDTKIEDISTDKTIIAKRYYSDLCIEVPNPDHFACATGLKPSSSKTTGGSNI
ncbi:SU10 major capsid protein [Campylobacter ureolyticus]|uniref:DUF5309 family protein n=1 Tax=Campylobacter ureolyticus TaxID=827 RepID=A0A9Q4KJG0_9BACT|nr:DUF5309 family protein [Campylobacter ureolyticus]MCZ6159032.1 DUF5309 family protein [Campylobacter ureolyticus]MCZ6162885.1 DUF5309 family protein [Campylobacter ureolyticus]MCZ6164622.1 DUF5309 family protein [Campylobacter ureolyticus]